MAVLLGALLSGKASKTPANERVGFYTLRILQPLRPYGVASDYMGLQL